MRTVQIPLRYYFDLSYGVLLWFIVWIILLKVDKNIDVLKRMINFINVFWYSKTFFVVNNKIIDVTIGRRKILWKIARTYEYLWTIEALHENIFPLLICKCLNKKNKIKLGDEYDRS